MTALPDWPTESCACGAQLYKQHFASEGGDDDEDEGEAVDGEGITEQQAPSAAKKRPVNPLCKISTPASCIGSPLA